MVFTYNLINIFYFKSKQTVVYLNVNMVSQNGDAQGFFRDIAGYKEVLVETPGMLGYQVNKLNKWESVVSFPQSGSSSTISSGNKFTENRLEK